MIEIDVEICMHVCWSMMPTFFYIHILSYKIPKHNYENR